MRRWAWGLGVALALGALLACGGGGDAGDQVGTIPHEAPPAVTVQHAIEPAAFEALAAQDADLARALATARAGVDCDGAIAAAGHLEDALGHRWDHATLCEAHNVWPVVVRACQAEACRALIARAGTPDLVWQDADGAPTEAPTLAAPALLKELPALDPEAATEVVQGALAGDGFPVYDVTKRRFVVASAWGAPFDLDLSALRDLAQASGAFDQVQYQPYSVDLGGLTELLAGDVLVVAGAGVRMQAASTGTYKTVGLTTSWGLFGDRTVHAGLLRSAVRNHVLRERGLPSLIVLAGGQTWGDGRWSPLRDDDDVSPDSLVRVLGETGRTVVAVEGSLDARALEIGTEALTACLLAGTPVGACVDEANGAFEARDLAARWRRYPAEGEGLALDVAVGDYWAGTPLGAAPARAEAYVRTGVLFECIDGSTGARYTPEEKDAFQNLYVREITDFDGPVLRKDWAYESTGTDVTLALRLPGRLAVDEPFLFSVTGDVSERMQQVTLYGLATVSGVKQGSNDKGAYWEIAFTGNLGASDFRFSNGDVCRLRLSEDSTEAMSVNSEPSWLRLFPLP